jgi:type I restriction enzyme S subunit
MESVRFGELYSIPSSNGVSRPSAVRGNGYKMINMGELFSNNIINDIPMERVLLSAKEKEKFIVQENDLLFARQSLVASGAGKCSIIKKLNEETTFESHLIRVRLNERICNSWYYYYLFQLPYNPIKTIVNQCAQAGIRGKELVRIKVPLPKLEEQNKIVNILSTYDDLIENNNRRIALLEKAAQELYKEWFVRFRFPGYETAEFENGFPVGWEVKKLFDVANVKYGYAFKSDLFCDDETLYPVVRIRDIPNNKTNTYTTEQCDERYLINENSIVIGMDGIFHMCLWNGGKAYLNQRVVEIESKNNNLNNLHLYYVLYPQVKYWEQTISGTTVAHLGDKHLKKLSVILPSEDICKKAKNFFDSIMLQKSALFKQNENLIKQRDLLLPRLMSGKLEV